MLDARITRVPAWVLWASLAMNAATMAADDTGDPGIFILTDPTKEQNT